MIIVIFDDFRFILYHEIVLIASNGLDFIKAENAPVDENTRHIFRSGLSTAYFVLLIDIGVPEQISRFVV